MPLYALALDLPADFFDVCFTEPHMILRMSRYPVIDGEDETVASLVPHTDSGFMTLLPPNRVPGLSIQLPSGHWIDAPGIDGAYVVNGGDILHRSAERILQNIGQRVQVLVDARETAEHVEQIVALIRRAEHRARYIDQLGFCLADRQGAQAEVDRDIRDHRAPIGLGQVGQQNGVLHRLEFERSDLPRPDIGAVACRAAGGEGVDHRHRRARPARCQVDQVGCVVHGALSVQRRVGGLAPAGRSSKAFRIEVQKRGTGWPVIAALCVIAIEDPVEQGKDDGFRAVGVIHLPPLPHAASRASMVRGFTATVVTSAYRLGSYRAIPVASPARECRCDRFALLWWR
ncbi:MAG TPA: 2OG-Fe(II) oxygenase family protein [Candidatus Dormibacteraeota bacterium]|nr:2OG-Fe(II) oxygenase family protein [Candidatus Dormibacteraeota bacterium]